jgi:hypothetical protein
MTKVFAAFWDGWGRVLRAPAILFGVFAVTWLVVYPAWRLLELPWGGHAPDVLDVLQGLPLGFYPTFTPTLLGTERFVRRLLEIAGGGMFDAGVVAASATTLLVWTFLLGGILDRYARRRPTRAQAFFGASGVCFFRFLRLGAVAALGHYLLFGLLHAWVFPPDFPWNAGGAAGASPMLIPVYAVFLLVVALWSAVVDYARIRAVVEDRRSMLGALVAGWRFVTRHPLETLTLYLLNAMAFGALLWAVLWLFGGVGSASRSMLHAAASCYLFLRLLLKLVFFASQTALFQRSLAHADYTAAPELLWPESPSAEEIINAAAARPPQP